MTRVHISVCFSPTVNDQGDVLLTEVKEGDWFEVMILIRQVHINLHQSGVARLETNIKVGTRLVKHSILSWKKKPPTKIIKLKNR